MEIREILKALQDKHITDQPYEVFLVDNTCYFGKDCNNNVVFMIPSRVTKVMPICQETRSLRFAFNKKCVRFLYKGIIIKHNENRANLH